MDGSGLTIDVRGPDAPLPLTSATQAQLLGIGREALANVVKHSGARLAAVHVEAHLDRVVVQIGDNGHGFEVGKTHPGHYGLESMRSRTREIGGELRIWSDPGKGTLISVEVPAETEVGNLGG
jgi:signal transduction histidine kinase